MQLLVLSTPANNVTITEPMSILKRKQSIDQSIERISENRTHQNPMMKTLMERISEPGMIPIGNIEFSKRICLGTSKKPLHDSQLTPAV